MVTTQIKLVMAVREIERATSPLASEVNILEVAPPGTAAINITPTANSGGKEGKNLINKKAIIGKIIIWEDNPTKKSRGCRITLVKSAILNPRPKENIINAIARGRKISEI